MASTFRHVGIVVADCDKYINLFSSCLDFDLISDEIESGEFISHLLSLKEVKIRVAKLRDQNGSVIEFIQYLNYAMIHRNVLVNSKGITHFAINTPNIEATISQLRAYNIKPINNPRINQTGDFKVVYLDFGESFFVELVENIRRVE